MFDTFRNRHYVIFGCLIQCLKYVFGTRRLVDFMPDAPQFDSEEELQIQNRLNLGNVYPDAGSSTGMNYQTRSIAQNNVLTYLTKKLNKNITELNSSISDLRSDLQKYDAKNQEMSNRIYWLSLVMLFLALIQAIPILSEVYLWFVNLHWLW